MKVAGLVGVVLAIVVAVAASRMGYRTILLIVAGASALTGILASIGLASEQVGPLTILAAMVGALHILLYALAARTFPTGSRATGIGLVAALGRTGTYVGPLIFSAYGMDAIVVATPVSLACVFLAILMTRRDDEPRGSVMDASAPTLETGR